MRDALKQPQPPTATQMAAAKKEAREFQVKYDVDYKRAESLIVDMDAKGDARPVPQTTPEGQPR